MELQLLGKGADSIVFRKGNTDRIIKFYGERAMSNSDSCDIGDMNEDKIRLYHSLQNRFAGNIYRLYLDSGDAKWAYFKRYIKLVTFEILSLDSTKIARASGFGEFKNQNFISVELDFINGKTIKYFNKTVFEHYHSYISFELSRFLAIIMQGTQISDLLTQEVMSGYGIDPYNIKYEIKSQRMHLVITDTLNTISSLTLN